MKLLAVIPHYRHLGTLPQVVAALRDCGLPVLVVDDGSGEDCRAGLEALREEGVQVAFRPVNGGKGSKSTRLNSSHGTVSRLPSSS